MKESKIGFVIKHYNGDYARLDDELVSTNYIFNCDVLTSHNHKYLKLGPAELFIIKSLLLYLYRP